MSWHALKKRYLAGIKAVQDGADPYETFWLAVIAPSPDVEAASHGELPLAWRYLTEDEEREIRNEANRRYAEPAQKRWAA